MHHYHILYIGQNECDITQFGNIFSGGPYRFWYAQNCEEVSALLRENPLDLVLFDAHMGKDGYSPANICPQMFHVDETPFLLVIDRDQDDLIDYAYTNDFVGLIGRPFRRNEVLKQVEHFIEYFELKSDFNFLGKMHLDYAQFANAFLLNTHDGIGLLDNKGVIKSFNLSASHLFKYTQDEICGKSINDLLTPEAIKLLKPCFEGGNGKSKQLFNRAHEIVGICKDQKQMVIDFYISKAARDKDEYVCIMNDSRVSNQLLSVYKKQAMQDALTGIPNRRCFDDVYNKEFKSAIRVNSVMTVLLIDIDYFKKYNDRYGHLAGDKVLTQVARIIQQSCSRPRDFCARYGGEEFVVTLPDTDERGGVLVATHILTRLKHEAILHEDSTFDGKLTLSVGIQSFRPAVEGEAMMYLDKADQALYKAKSEGRNRFYVDHA